MSKTICLAMMAFFTNSIAFAQAEQKIPGTFETLVVPIGIMLFLFYFMLLRPQAKRSKEQQTLLKSIKKGDDVLTSSGVFGKITGLTDTVVTLEVSEGVRIKMLRSNVVGLSDAHLKEQTPKPT